MGIRSKVLLALIVFVYIYWIAVENIQFLKKYPATIGNTATIFLIDGLSDSVFQQEMKAGRLPILQDMIGRGTYIKNGISSFPTMTGYGYYPFLTGIDATESGILGLRWFDRSRQDGNFRNYVGRTNIRINQDLNKDIKNIFELSKPFYTASINNIMDKGASHSVKTGWSHSTAKYENKGVLRWLRAIPFIGKSIAPNHLEQETKAMKLALRQLSKNPKVHWITFPSPDASNHVVGTNKMYVDLLHHIDSLIGIYLKQVDKLGQKDSRMIAAVSDHGVSDVYENLDFCTWFGSVTGLKTERGKSINILSSALEDPISEFDDQDGFFVINGNLMAYLYMKNPNSSPNLAWSKKLPKNLLEAYPGPKGDINIPEILSSNNHIELVMYNDGDDKIIIRDGDLTAEIQQDSSGNLSYQPLTGNPLHYPENLCHVYMDRDNWLNKTQNTIFPYALVRIRDLMNKSNVGDIVITSRKGVDLAYNYEIIVNNYKGGHGGLRKEIISVPYIYTIPGEKPTQLNAMPNEDMGKIMK